MPKIYRDENVLEAALRRLKYVFSEFDNVYFCVSGGKDSSVMVQLAESLCEELGKTYDVMYIDFEAQYAATIEHIGELKKLKHIDTFYHIALPMALRNAVSMLQPKWICWDEDKKDLWVRPIPENAITLKNCPFDFYRYGEEFEDFIHEFACWYHLKKGGKTACCVGIRADESLSRFQTVANPGRKVTYKDEPWTTKIHQTEEIYNAFPIIDWRVEDIWGAVSQLGLKMNQIYELMYKNGLSIYRQRLCQPYGDDQRNGLDQFRALEPDTWEKIINRVNGVNFGNLYCRTSALGNITSMKPDDMEWEQYAVFLMESIGLYNRALMEHYYGKIKKFIRWYEKHEGITLKDIPGEADKKLEQQKKAISWRRIARALEKNDFYMKRLSFAQTKGDEKKLQTFVNTWSNFLTKESAAGDKDLNRFMERREMENG